MHMCYACEIQQLQDALIFDVPRYSLFATVRLHSSKMVIRVSHAGPYSIIPHAASSASDGEDSRSNDSAENQSVKAGAFGGRHLAS